MNRDVQVSAVQFNPRWLDSDANAEAMAEIASEEARRGSDLVVFPELANTGYVVAPPDMDTAKFARRFYEAAEPLPGPSTSALGKVASESGIYIVAGLAAKHPHLAGSLFNTAVLIGPDGGIVGTQNKVHIPLEEKCVFTPGDEIRSFGTELGRIGVAICYDARFPETTRIQALQGADIICSLWNRYYIEGFMPTSEGNYSMAFIRAQENAVFFVFCTRSGKEGVNEYMGHSAIASPKGELLAVSSTSDAEVVRAVLKHEDLLDSRQWLNIYADRRPSLYGAISSPSSGMP